MKHIEGNLDRRAHVAIEALQQPDVMQQTPVFGRRVAPAVPEATVDPDPKIVHRIARLWRDDGGSGEFIGEFHGISGRGVARGTSHETAEINERDAGQRYQERGFFCGRSSATPSPRPPTHGLYPRPLWSAHDDDGQLACPRGIELRAGVVAAAVLGDDHVDLVMVDER